MLVSVPGQERPRKTTVPVAAGSVSVLWHLMGGYNNKQQKSRQSSTVNSKNDLKMLLKYKKMKLKNRFKQLSKTVQCS